MSNTLGFLQLVLAQGEGGNQGPAGGYAGLIMIVLMFAVIYLLIIRPANKQRREHQQMLQNLKKGDDVVTNGGIYGKITAVEDKVVTLEIADKVKVKVVKDRISGRWAQSSESDGQG